MNWLHLAGVEMMYFWPVDSKSSLRLSQCDFDDRGHRHQKLSCAVNNSLESACTSDSLPLVWVDVVFNHKAASSSEPHPRCSAGCHWKPGFLRLYQNCLTSLWCAWEFLLSATWRRSLKVASCRLEMWLADQDHVSYCRRPEFSITTSICSASSEESAPSCWNATFNASRTLAGISLALLQRHQRICFFFFFKPRTPFNQNRFSFLRDSNEFPSRKTHVAFKLEDLSPDVWHSPGDIKAALFLGDQVPQQLSVLCHTVLHVQFLLLRYTHTHTHTFFSPRYHTTSLKSETANPLFGSVSARAAGVSCSQVRICGGFRGFQRDDFRLSNPRSGLSFFK